LRPCCRGAATQEIASNAQQAAEGTTHVAANIVDVNKGAVETGSASSQVLASARTLAGESNRLRDEVYISWKRAVLKAIQLTFEAVDYKRPNLDLVLVEPG